MSDRRILELAAKAAREWPSPQPFEHVLNRWNPRDDDGDSRRLQVALDIDLYIRHEWAEAVGPMQRPIRVWYTEAPKAEACRLAVLRVAAAIGGTK